MSHYNKTVIPARLTNAYQRSTFRNIGEDYSKMKQDIRSRNN